MKDKTRFVVAFATSLAIAAALAIAPRSVAMESVFDATFQHSHMRVEDIQVLATYPDLEVEIVRVGFTPSLILVEMRAKNTGTLPVDFAPELGYVSIGEFRVQANPFATQALGNNRESLIEPGDTRHLVVVYPGQFGQRNWDENAVTALDVHLWQENQDSVSIELSGRLSSR